MAPDLIDRVFDLFVQGERSLAREPGGLGIGLTMAKRLVELHNGTIRATSAGRSPRAARLVAHNQLLTARRQRMRMLHTMIRVNDLDESLRFYCDQLGMKLLRKATRPRWTPFFRTAQKRITYREWLPFISLADASYWNVELTQD